MTAAALPYIIAAGSTALQLNAQSEAASERRRILNQQLDANDRATKKASDLVLKEAENFAPDARKQAMQDAEQKAYEQSQADLAGAGGAIIDTAGSGGNVSADFVKASADRAVSEGNRLTAVAREAAKTRAPSLLGQTEAQRRANLAGELQSSASTNRNLASAAQADIGSVQEPAYGQIGSLIGSLGSSYLAANNASNSAGIFGGKSPIFSGGQNAAPIFDRSFR